MKKRLYRYEYVFDKEDKTIGVVIRYNYEGEGWKTQSYFMFNGNGLRLFTEQTAALEAMSYKKESHCIPLFVSEELMWNDGDNTFKGDK